MYKEESHAAKSNTGKIMRLCKYTHVTSGVIMTVTLSALHHAKLQFEEGEVGGSRGRGRRERKERDGRREIDEEEREMRRRDDEE